MRKNKLLGLLIAVAGITATVGTAFAIYTNVTSDHKTIHFGATSGKTDDYAYKINNLREDTGHKELSLSGAETGIHNIYMELGATKTENSKYSQDVVLGHLSVKVSGPVIAHLVSADLHVGGYTEGSIFATTASLNTFSPSDVSVVDGLPTIKYEADLAVKLGGQPVTFEVKVDKTKIDALTQDEVLTLAGEPYSVDVSWGVPSTSYKQAFVEGQFNAWDEEHTWTFDKTKHGMVPDIEHSSWQWVYKGLSLRANEGFKAVKLDDEGNAVWAKDGPVSNNYTVDTDGVYDIYWDGNATGEVYTALTGETPNIPVTPDPVETTAFYAQVPATWGDSVNLYAWEDAPTPTPDGRNPNRAITELGMEWPGVAMEQVEGDLYKVEIANTLLSTIDKIIVNDGTNQTVDIAYDGTSNAVYVKSNSEVALTTWSEEGGIVEPTWPEAEITTLYVEFPASYSAVPSLYVWGSQGGLTSGWPGDPLVEVSKDDTKHIFSIELDNNILSNATGMKVAWSNGGEETNEIIPSSLVENNLIIVNGNKTDATFGVYDPNAAEQPGEGEGTETPEPVTTVDIKIETPEWWTDADALTYVHTDKTTWPGTKVELVENETKVYATEITSDITTLVIARVNPTFDEALEESETNKLVWNQTIDVTLEDIAKLVDGTNDLLRILDDKDAAGKSTYELSTFVATEPVNPDQGGDSGDVTPVERAVVYSTGFEASENFGKGTTYNNKEANEFGPTDKTWGITQGTVTDTDASVFGDTNGQIIQMRSYKSVDATTGGILSAQTNFESDGVAGVKFQAHYKNTACTIKVSYSTDAGTTWNEAGLCDIAEASTAEEFIVELNELALDNVMVKFDVIFDLTVAEGLVDKSRVSIDNVSLLGAKVA